MIVVHHLNNSRSQRILWLLEELGLPYEIKRYERDPATMLAPKELFKVHPLGKSPVITDGETTVAESGAIIEYLVERYGNGRLAPAAGTPERVRYTYWLHFAEGSAMPPMLLALVLARLSKPPVPALIRPLMRAVTSKVMSAFVQPRWKANIDYMESQLAASEWFAGAEFTAADIQLSFPLEASAARGAITAEHPRLQDFLKRIHARPAYRRALENGGPYTLQ